MESHEDLKTRMALIEARVAQFGEELHRTRDRLHDVENDRHAIRLLAVRVDTLANEMGELGRKLDRVVDGMEALATRVARETVRLAFDEWEDEREETALKRWANLFALIAVGVAAGGFTLAVIQAIAHGGG